MSEIYEGNFVTINNLDKNKAKITINGGSRQATRSGYNLANLDADSFVKNGVTVTNNGDGSWTFNGTSSSFDDLILTKNISLNHKIYQFEDAKYLFKTIVVSGSFSNPDNVLVQTSAMGQDNGVDNFGTLYNKLSDGVFVNIFNKKSTSHLSRFELYCGPNVTFNNYTIKILFAKTDNKELEWEQYGVSPSPDFPSEIKNVGDDVKMTVCNKNLASWDNKNISFENIISEAIEGNIIKTEGNEGIVNLAYSGGISRIKFSKKLKFGTQYTLSVKIRLLKQGKWSNQTQFFFGNKEKYSSEEQRFELTLNTYVLCVFNFKPKLENEDIFTIYLNSNKIEIDLNTLQIEENTAATDYIPHEEQTITFPLEEGQKFYEGSYLAEDGIHNKRRQKEFSGAKEERFEINTNYSTESMLVAQILVNDMKTGTQNIISNYFSYNSITKTGTTRAAGNYLLFGLDKSTFPDIETFKTFLAQKKAEENPVLVEYELAEEEIIPYTQEQQNAFYQLQNIVLYDGINHISTDNELGSMSVEVSKIIEDYETYISSNGFFINSQNDIHYLIDFSESELPCMAEATETTVKAAGRNGDIVLSTTYDANNFNIVCYTEDNLTQEEKVKEEMKLKKLLNSIKNKTIPLAFEKDDKFYKVKYSGAFSSTNFPKHLKFSIPLKTSEAYGKDLIKKVIFGNGEETSDTFEDVGAIFTIKGPANSPIISLNDYSIEYDNPLLEGDKLIINSSNSTITHINSDGVATNAMRYYNHQFPKIENGKNVLKVLSGVNEANVSVEWYDYKF